MMISTANTYVPLDSLDVMDPNTNPNLSKVRNEVVEERRE